MVCVFSTSSRVSVVFVKRDVGVVAPEAEVEGGLDMVRCIL